MSSGSQVAWIGLGKLGLPMAVRMVAAGIVVRGHDRSAERLDLAASRGIQPAQDAASAVRGASHVFISLPDDRALWSAALSDATLLSHLSQGSVLVETSTVSVGISHELAEAAARRGVRYLRSPVSGNPVSAESGQLSALVSGPRDAFEETKPLLNTFCHALNYLGDTEQARYAKLAINLMIAVSAGMMAEALALARRGDIAWQDMLTLMENSAIGSPMVKYKCLPLKDRDFTATFSGRQMAKDLDLILACARAADVPAPLAAQMRETYTAMVPSGLADRDYVATILHQEHLAGLGEPDLKHKI